MATGQTLLDTMELLNQELQLQTGEADVVRGLIALNRAQDYFESLVAREVELLGDNTSTVTTTASTETTAFPTGLLRLDRLQYIDPITSLPAWDLRNIRRTGGATRTPLWFMSPATGTGKPTGYWTNGRSIYWLPLPDGTHTVRWHGLQAATDITAGGTFLFPDICVLPFASFAAYLLSLGVGDAVGDMTAAAAAAFTPVIKTMSNFNRDGFQELSYSQNHST